MIFAGDIAIQQIRHADQDEGYPAPDHLIPHRQKHDHRDEQQPHKR